LIVNTKDFLRLGVPLGEATRRAIDFVSKFILGGGDKTKLREEVSAIVADPAAFTEDPLRGEFAKALLKATCASPSHEQRDKISVESPPSPRPSPPGEGEPFGASRQVVRVRKVPLRYRQWGEGLEHEAVMQMEKACLLPVAVAGALMPDAHVGYGLPIGGVLLLASGSNIVELDVDSMRCSKNKTAIASQ
jgi:tRNA-splicing ligase RtcB (3'-phosphate/5'-hydroxy nucleic acid ligase)